MTAPDRLDGTIVVTGAASGIGAAVVQIILERDPDAVVVGLDLAGGSATPSDRFRLLSADVTDPGQVAAVFQAIDELGGPPLRGLVCAAGILQRRPTVDLPAADWRRMIGVHLDGTFLCAQQARPRMPRGGAIVAFSSVAEVFGWPERAAYAAAKAGISSLVRSLAVEWADAGIRANAVAPGYVSTPMIENARKSHALLADPAALHALKRLARPVEIAAPTRFLLTDDASFITGSTMVVDGGYHVLK